MTSEIKQVAFLRGINVGGHHKLPMAVLKDELRKLNLINIATVLNSGNILFESTEVNLENKISNHLEQVFGFSVPVVIKQYKDLLDIHRRDPFQGIEVTKDIRLYVSFLKEDVKTEMTFPWISSDYSYQILSQKEKTIYSVLDLSVSKTPKAMDALEQQYGKGITTRNWNTIGRIIRKGEAQNWN